MIAVTFALPEESQDFIRLLGEVEWLEKGRLPVLRGRLNGKEIVVCHTGVGPARAAERARALLAMGRFERVVSAGFAGGLDPRLAAGQVFIGENFSSPALVEAARAIPGERFYGRLTTQERIVENAAEKARLFNETGAAAVDMETESIHLTCKAQDTPMLSVRSISDAACDPLPVPYAVWFDAATQSPRVGSLLVFLATHPARITPFARFVGNVNRARRALTGFLAANLEL